MIPRYQRVLFYTLAVVILLLAAFTIRERQKAHRRVTAATDAMPFIEPADAQTESITLLLANDADATLVGTLRDAALPHEPSLRARALLERLLSEYAQPGSAHPLKPGNPAVTDVFLLKLPLGAQAAADPFAPTGLLAVVNLHGTFADAHPSGVLVESLTVQSILGTLHANLPQITQVRFLVDGQPRESLAGHADLSHAYDAAEPAPQPTQPVAQQP